MIRSLNISVACLVLTGYAFAQVAPPAAPQGPGRAGVVLPPVVIGPPAPVPPEVAIPRPTPEELAQVNSAVKQWIAGDKSPSKPLLQKFESLLLLQPPRLNPAATYTQTQQRMGPRHLGFVETASKGNIDLLLHGDSITDFWAQNDANKAMFEKYFGNIKTANFAVSGDTTQGVLWGLKNGEGQGFQPKAIMLMIGTNNTGSLTATEVAEGVGADVLEMRKDFPNAKILLLAIRGARRAIRSATRLPRSTGLFRGSTTSSMFSIWTLARSSWMRRDTSCRSRFGPITCTHWPRVMTSGALLLRTSWRN